MNFIASAKSTLASALDNTANWIDDTAIPAVAVTAQRTVDGAEIGTSVITGTLVGFLLNHPGISMMLSLGTVTKACAAHHVDQIIAERTGVAGRSTDRVATMFAADSQAC